MATILNARAFGADNTGVANASAAINAAIAALPARGGVVIVPAGTYRIDATINVNGTPTKSVVLQGDGENATVFKPAANNVSPLVVIQTNSGVTGIEFDGTGKTGINGARFNSSGSYLENFVFRAIDGRAIDLNDSVDGGLYFNDVRHGRISSSCGYGIWIATTVAANNSINDNRFYNISITTCLNDGIYIDKGNGNKFIGVDVEDCAGFGVNIQNGQDNYFNCWLEDNAAGNILIIRDTLNRGNQFWGRGEEGFASQVDTTGAITINTPTLTVASATNIVKGKYLKIVGAGAAGVDLYSYVTAISGTTITLHTNALTTVGPTAVVTGPELDASGHLIYHTQRFTHFTGGLVVLANAQFGQKGKSSSTAIESYGGMTLYPPGGGNAAQYLFRMDSTCPSMRFTDGSTVRVIIDRASGDTTISTGNLLVGTAGKGLRIGEGANAKMGTAVLIAGAATVATTAVTASSRILITSQVDGGTPGFIRVSARTPGTSFVITSSNGADTSTVAWFIVEPA